MQKFIEKHYKISFFIAIVIFVISGIGSKYSSFIYIVAISFGFSLATFFRLITYKYGKIPFFMIDKTWDHYTWKYSEEEIEEKYEQMSIKRAAIYLKIAIISCPIWLLCEAVLWLTEIF